MLSARLLLPLGLALLPAVGGCELLLPESCPDLDEVCPDVQCEDQGGYVQNREGCSICECVDGGGPEPGAVCWDDGECGDGQRCDTVNYCEPAPNCEPGGPCPDACYGRCVEEGASCTSDADCQEGQLCAFFTNERPDAGAGEEPAPPPDGDEAAPAPVEQGVCIDVTCGNADVALPQCPPGSELVFDPAIDPCGPVCIAVDFCRQLLPEECLSFPNQCTLVEEPCGCTGQNCDCAFVQRCVAVEDCASLPLELCETNPACALRSIGGESGGGEDGGAPAPCDPDDANCDADPAPPPPPEEQLVCVPRGGDGACVSDIDCGFGEVCQLETVCGSGCAVDESGQEHCFEECWTEQGLCVPSTRTCFDLLPDACTADPRCELVQGAAPCVCDANDPDCGCEEGEASLTCVPRDGACSSDNECLDGQHCAFVESCPPCDPSSGDDLDCLAPCFVEGRCVDGAPPPVSCQVDSDCGAGFACTPITVCDACGGGAPGAGEGEGARPEPAPCDPACRDELVCVATEPVCFTDADCEGGFCDLSQSECGGGTGNGLVACAGVCVLPEPALCQSDDQCGAGQRCATELDHCLENPAQPDVPGCWTVCVDDSAAGGSFCLDDDACTGDNGGSGTCRFHADVCLDDPSTDAQLCSGWCVTACGEAETPATDPASGQCIVFPDTCIPPGWERVDAC